MTKAKVKEDEEREDLEAQLMGGEVQEPEDEPVAASQIEPEPGEEPEPEPEVTVEELRERLTKAEKERHDFERAMREEREAKKASDRTLQSLVERLEQVQAERQIEKPVSALPVFEDDPAAYLKWQNDQILADRQREKEERNQEIRQSKEIQQYQQLHQTIKQGINQYAETTPDYNDAAKFLIESRLKELEIMGISNKQEQFETLSQEEVQVGAWALQRGISPGELIYNLAKTRGYQRQNSPTNISPEINIDKPKPKSLSNISGSPSGNKESLQARAERILTATNLKDVLALNPDDMEKILRERLDRFPGAAETPIKLPFGVDTAKSTGRA